MIIKNKGLATVSVAMILAVNLASAATGNLTSTGGDLTSTGVDSTTNAANSSTGAIGDTFKIDKVDASVAKTIDIFFTRNVSKDGVDIKVMEDNRISSVNVDSNDAKKVKLSLDKDLVLNSSYNLFLVSGPEGSMSFSLSGELATGSIVNTETTGDQNIASISFVDSKNIEVTFKKDVVGNPEFKLLREISIDKINVLDNKVTILTKEDLSSAKSYTLTIASLKDDKGNDIDSENSVYDFNYTGVDNSVSSETSTGIVDLNAASGATTSTGENASSGKNTPSVQAKTLPDTGTKENLIFIFSLFLALFVVLYYRKKIAR